MRNLVALIVEFSFQEMHFFCIWSKRYGHLSKEIDEGDSGHLVSHNNKRKMKPKNPVLTAVLNFFFIGLGYVYLGNKRLLGIGMTLAGFMLTYVELSIKDTNTQLYWLMFAGVFVLNSCLAIDGFQSAKNHQGTEA